MARINIEDSIYQDLRFAKLMLKTGSMDAAIGSMVRAWSLAQAWFLNTETKRMIPVDEWKKQEINDAILEVGLAVNKNGYIYVSGSKSQFGWLIQRSEAGKKSGHARKARSEENHDERPLDSVEHPLPAVNGSEPLSLSPSLPLSPSLSPALTPSLRVLPDDNDLSPGTTVKKPRARKPVKEAPTKETWESFTSAYMQRYGVEPIRNATVNSKMKQFVERVGVTEAPEIAKFYVFHNSQRYTNSAHSIGNMLFDSEKLRTEWISGKQINSNQTRQIEKKQNLLNVYEEYKAKRAANGKA